ncbi:MAG: type II toxin-antitoxin system Phd/YefM family antitoxin [Acidobacteriota bacterium]
MRAVGLKILKNKLSEYVRLVTGGETVLVTNQGRVVAELVPPQQGRSPFPADAQLAAAVSKGWITPPTMPTRGAPPRLPVAPLEEILQEILDDREAR